MRRGRLREKRRRQHRLEFSANSRWGRRRIRRVEKEIRADLQRFIGQQPSVSRHEMVRAIAARLGDAAARLGDGMIDMIRIECTLPGVITDVAVDVSL